MKLKDLIKRFLELRNEMFSLYIEGPPGAGKTSIIKETCREKNLKIKELSMLALLDEDVSGLQYPTGEKLTYLKPFWLETADVYFFDEFGGCSSRKQTALLKLITEKKFADGTNFTGKIIFAGNASEDNAGDEIIASMRARISFIKWTPTVEEFTDYLSTVGEEWAQRMAGFLKKNPSAFLIKDNESGILATPRLLTEIAKILVDPENEIELAMAVGLHQVAYEYFNYIKNAKMLSYSEWKNGRKEYLKDKEPSDIAILYYAIPIMERIDFFEDLKEIQSQIFSGLMKEFAESTFSTITDMELKERYIKYLTENLKVVKNTFIKKRDEIKKS